MVYLLCNFSEIIFTILLLRSSKDDLLHRGKYDASYAAYKMAHGFLYIYNAPFGLCISVCSEVRYLCWTSNVQVNCTLRTQ